MSTSTSAWYAVRNEVGRLPACLALHPNRPGGSRPRCHRRTTSSPCSPFCNLFHCSAHSHVLLHRARPHALPQYPSRRLTSSIKHDIAPHPSPPPRIDGQPSDAWTGRTLPAEPLRWLRYLAPPSPIPIHPPRKRTARTVTKASPPQSPDPAIPRRGRKSS